MWQQEQVWASYCSPSLLYSIDTPPKIAKSSEMLLQDRMVLQHPQHDCSLGAQHITETQLLKLVQCLNVYLCFRD